MRQCHTAHKIGLCDVSIHALRRVRHGDFPFMHYALQFQSTHPKRCDFTDPLAGFFLERFNPRTHKGCDVSFRTFPHTSHVSIHALIKGATHSRNNREERRWVSIHAPMKGATLVDREACGCPDVSIHAPMKGATPWWPRVRCYLRFQSTHP